MLSSKEICDTFNLTHYGREIKLISFTSLDQVKENSIIFLKNVSLLCDYIYIEYP